MALTFNDSKGSAQKNTIDSYEFQMGRNEIRLVGDILARYVYWLKGENDKAIPMECLSFDRDLEKFTNVEKDWIREFFPDLKCSWSYAAQRVTDEKIQVVNLKKKLWLEIISTAEDLGDPTDPDTGWDIVFEKVKTGALAYNVEYRLKPLQCKVRPLTEKEKAVVAEHLKPIDEIMARPTPSAQKELLDRITGASKANVDDKVVSEEFDEISVEDVPF